MVAIKGVSEGAESVLSRLVSDQEEKEYEPETEAGKVATKKTEMVDEGEFDLRQNIEFSN